jgi:hypothetical protein
MTINDKSTNISSSIEDTQPGKTRNKLKTRIYSRAVRVEIARKMPIETTTFIGRNFFEVARRTMQNFVLGSHSITARKIQIRGAQNKYSRESASSKTEEKK